MNRRLAVAGLAVAIAAAAGGCGRVSGAGTSSGAPVVSSPSSGQVASVGSGQPAPTSGPAVPTTATRSLSANSSGAGTSAAPSAVLQQAQTLTNRVGDDLSSTSSDLAGADRAIANGG